MAAPGKKGSLMRVHALRRILAGAIAIAFAAVPLHATAAQQPGATPQDHSVDPVVLTGAQFPGWSAGPEVTVREPQVANDATGLQSDCGSQSEPMPDGTTNHSCQSDSRLPRVQSALGIEGAPVARMLGYVWTGAAWKQIPFQVDERYTRYLTNNQSGFAFYSGSDKHTTYAFDREGYRFVDSEPTNLCVAKQRGATGADPIKGLDDNDEMAFMYSDAGIAAPARTALPEGIAEAREVTVADPARPFETRTVYVMLAAPSGPDPAYSAANGYVRYQRDADAGMFVYSQSSYGNYGNAPKGPYCNPDGTPALNADGSRKIAQRRPKDTAWIYTPRYKFRYEGRWLMTALHVHGPGMPTAVALGNEAVDATQYKADLIDRWKARAFAQDPSSKTPCCGYEEEDTNWGGSSILMGERSGPVRTIRETWGADSSTNNARRETFYRDTVVWGDALRVHPIPPLDGIYIQWDYNVGAVGTYYNPARPGGVAIDGVNDEVVGNLDDPCNARYTQSDRSALDTAYRNAYAATPVCGVSPYHQSVDVSDPTSSHPNSLQWEEVAGDNGSIVSRWSIREHSAGDAYSVVAVPYYRDDSCFDDGTGSSPGPKLHLRSGDEPSTWMDASGATGQRRCWKPGNPLPDPSFVNYGPGGDREGDERYYQGSIGTAGVHIMFIVDSDNAALTEPVDEIDTEQRMVVLEGDPGNVGELYGRSVEQPLTTAARPFL